jgi:hypothetical protein
MHEDHDSFYHSRKSSIDIEGGCLVPSDSADGAMPDLTSKKTSRRGIYAEYRRWFKQSSPRASAIQLPLAEKSAEYLEPRYRSSKFERRLQTGSWCAMVVLLVLTIYFLMRET